MKLNKYFYIIQYYIIYMKVLVLNKNNIVPDSNNSKLRYKFNSTVNFKKKSKIALSKINIYYSWQNISDQFNNRTFSYSWWDASGNSTSFSLTIPQGYYSADDINNWMYGELVARNHFLTYSALVNVKGYSNGIDWASTTKYIFIELMENSTYYSLQFRLYSLPTFVSSSPPYTKPNNIGGFDWRVPSNVTINTFSHNQSPKIIIPSTNKFCDLVGFIPGTYGTGYMRGAYEDILSTYTPTIDPVGSILVMCSMANNIYASPSNLIDSFTYSVDYGGMIAIENNNLNWINIAEGSYSEFFVEFKNQNFGNLIIQDPSMVITMIIDEPEEDIILK